MNNSMEVLAQREGVEEVQNRLKMSDGFELFYRRWNTSSPERVMILLHGTGGHSGDYRGFAQDIAANGIEVYAPDARGFGNSLEEGLPRGDTTSKPVRWLRDLDELVALVRSSHPGMKVFLMGHSGGANAILWYASRRPDSVDGLIVAAPGIKLPPGFHKGRFVLRMVFLRAFAPKKMIGYDAFLPNQELKGENFQMWQEDPLSSPKLSARFLFRTGPTMASLRIAKRIAQPTLIIQGEADKWTVPEGSKELLGKLAAKDKTLRTFPEADHFFYGAVGFKPTSRNDPVKRRGVADVVSNWLKVH